MSRVFVSHSPRDDEAVLLLVGELKKAGHEVLREGREVGRVPMDIEASDVFLLLISADSVGSESVEKELLFAAGKSKQIVPVMVGMVELPEKFEYVLAGLQRIDLSQDFKGGMSQVLGAVAWVGSQQHSPLDGTHVPTTDSARLARTRERHRGLLNGIVCWGLGSTVAALMVTGGGGLHQSELYLNVGLCMLYGSAIGFLFSRTSMRDGPISTVAIMFTTMVVFVNGGVFWMLYGRSHPFFQSPDGSGQEDWRFYSSFGPIFGGTLWAISKMALSRWYIRNLKTLGRRLETEYKGVRNGSARGVHGCFAQQIVSQWCDPRTNELTLFYSKNLWFDPSRYVDSKTITVYLDPTNPQNYLMDLSFLPKVRGSFWRENLSD
jgi:hypothetical protein